MPFDINSAKPVGSSGGFDLGTAKPVVGVPGDEDGNIAQGLLRGFNRVVGTLGDALYKVLPDNPRYAKQREEFKRFNADLNASNSGPDGKPLPLYDVGDMGGQVIATAPVGGAVAAPLKAIAAVTPRAAPFIAPIADAIETSGMRAAGMTGVKGVATRSVGGAVTGGTSAALVDPQSAEAGAALGAVAPSALKLVGKAGEAAGKAFRPFTARGRDDLAGQVLRETAIDPATARAALTGASEVVPGSAPIAAAAAGDAGLSGLNRTVQSVSPQYAAELANRQTAQNAARTTALEQVAGNPGKIAAAKEARDAATDQMRESVLAAAGTLDANAITRSLERMMRNPDNAGATARAGLQRVLDQVRAIAADSGGIDARALYEIRKDIGLAMSGKLQGEAGNLRYARGALDRVQSMFDTAIDQASRRVPQSSGTALVPGGINLARAGAAPIPNMGPRPTWQQYLSEYSRQSVPINQMELLDDVLKRVQTGTVDQLGNPVLSAAKLNTILKNEGQELMTRLAPEHVDLLRRVAADLNASQLAMTTGKAVGSDTVQKAASGSMLKGLIGNAAGDSMLARTLIARPIDWFYRGANEAVTDRLGRALLDPQEAARLMANPQRSGLGNLFAPVRQLGYRAAPLLPAQNSGQ